MFRFAHRHIRTDTSSNFRLHIALVFYITKSHVNKLHNLHVALVFYITKSHVNKLHNLHVALVFYITKSHVNKLHNSHNLCLNLLKSTSVQIALFLNRLRLYSLTMPH